MTSYTKTLGKHFIAKKFRISIIFSLLEEQLWSSKAIKPQQQKIAHWNHSKPEREARVRIKKKRKKEKNCILNWQHRQHLNTKQNRMSSSDKACCSPISLCPSYSIYTGALIQTCTACWLVLHKPKTFCRDLENMLNQLCDKVDIWPWWTWEKSHGKCFSDAETLNKTGPVVLYTSNKDKIMTLVLYGATHHSFFNWIKPHNAQEITVVWSILVWDAG